MPPLPAKNRLIISLIFGLLTLFSSVIAPKIQAESIIQPVLKPVEEYAVLHLDQKSLAPTNAPKAIIAISTATSTTATSTTKVVVYKSPSQIHQIVASYFKATPILVDIAECESHFRQYNKSGSVYRGSINTSDVGVMQINEKYHLQTAKRMGIDLYSLDGNLAYAKYLYKKEGTDPWLSSSACWGEQTAYNNVNVSNN